MERVIERMVERYPAVFEAPEEYRLQILLAEVETEGAVPTLRRSGFRVDEEYFYPASTVKLASAVLAAQIVAELPGVELSTPMRLHPSFPGEEVVESDPTHVGGAAVTVGHELRKLFLVSDNEAHNRLYELAGYERTHERLHAAGLESARMLHRLSERRTVEENRRTPKTEFLLEDGRVVEVPEAVGRPLWRNLEPAGLDVGVARMVDGEKVDGPMSFRDKNRFSLTDLQNLLAMVVRPDVELDLPGLELTPEHRAFLMQAMREYPAQSEDPVYDPAAYPDHWVKFFLPGLEKVAAKEELAIYNKIGLAYGFGIENSYVVHEPTGRSFFLSAVLYANPNGVLNDDDYAYATLMEPFMADLAEEVARELWEAR